MEEDDNDSIMNPTDQSVIEMENFIVCDTLLDNDDVTVRSTSTSVMATKSSSCPPPPTYGSWPPIYPNIPTPPNYVKLQSPPFTSHPRTPYHSQFITDDSLLEMPMIDIHLKFLESYGHSEENSKNRSDEDANIRFRMMMLSHRDCHNSQLAKWQECFDSRKMVPGLFDVAELKNVITSQSSSVPSSQIPKRVKTVTAAVIKKSRTSR